MAEITQNKYHPTGSCEIYDYDEDEYNIRLYIRKQNALLYIHLHQELLAENKYKIVYDVLRDEKVRKVAYFMDNKIITEPITEEQRNVESRVLDILIEEYGRDKVEKYRKDADYIANRIAEGKTF